MSNLDGPPYYDSGLGDVPVPAAVAPLAAQPDGSFPSMRTSCIIGAPKLLSDLTSRDAIPAGLRAEGMIAYVQATGLTYQLQGGITNGDWVDFGAGGGTLAEVLVAGNTTGGTSILVTSGDAIRGNPGATGATLTLAGGASSGTAAGGTLALVGGAPTEGAGGSVTITGANGATGTATSRAGGSITLQGGTGASGGAGGLISLLTPGGVAITCTGNAITTSSGAIGLYGTAGVYVGGGGVSNDFLFSSTGLQATLPVRFVGSLNDFTGEITRGGQVTWTNNVATTVSTLSLASGARVSGRVFYDIDCSDGTDHQALSGQIAFAAVDKAGTLTSSLDSTLAQQSLALSAGTLTVSWSVLDGANLISLQVTVASSLTPTTRVIRLRTEFGSAASVLTIP